MKKEHNKKIVKEQVKLQVKLNFDDIDPRLCNYCGACVAVCPKNCLSLTKPERIHFKKSDCIQCGLCYKNCQGIDFDFPAMRNAFFANTEFHDLLGNYIDVYFAQATDEDTLKKSTSGGMVGSILNYTFQNKIIDSAVLLAKDSNDPFGYKAIVARSKKEINSRTKSLYRITSIVQVLRMLKSSDKKVAFVGLPCQIEAIRKLQSNNSGLTRNIKLTIGIFCGLNQRFKATEYLIKKINIKKSDVDEIGYRGYGWPGGFYVKKRGSSKSQLIKVPKDTCDFTNYMFMIDRCLLCYDFTNEFADISVGDAWSKLPSKYGWSEVITRTKLGDQIIKKLADENLIKIEKSSPKAVIKSHPGNFSFKKKGIFYRFKRFGYYPNIHIKPTQCSFKTTVFNAFYFCFINTLRARPIRVIISIFPINLIGTSIYVLKKFVRIILVKK